MKTTTMIARILLGLTFLVFGLNGLFQFIKLPPPSGVALQFLGALVVSHENIVIMGLQVLAGVLLLLNRFVPLALFVLAPIVLNILFFHFFMDQVESRERYSFSCFGCWPRLAFQICSWRYFARNLATPNEDSKVSQLLPFLGSAGNFTCTHAVTKLSHFAGAFGCGGRLFLCADSRPAAGTCRRPGGSTAADTASRQTGLGLSAQPFEAGRSSG